MEELKLIEPNTFLESEYHQMLEEWRLSGEHLTPFVLQCDSSDFKKFIDLLNGFTKGIDISEDFVPHSTYWLVNTHNRILGVVNIRHRLNDHLIHEGGHIGYGIRPSERRKGYATKILELALLKAKSLAIDKVYVTCDKGNIGSQKTILKNEGKFNEEKIIGQSTVLSYWINIINH